MERQRGCPDVKHLTQLSTHKEKRVLSWGVVKKWSSQRAHVTAIHMATVDVADRFVTSYGLKRKSHIHKWRERYSSGCWRYQLWISSFWWNEPMNRRLEATYSSQVQDQFDRRVSGLVMWETESDPPIEVTLYSVAKRNHCFGRTLVPIIKLQWIPKLIFLLYVMHLVVLESQHI